MTLSKELREVLFLLATVAALCVLAAGYVAYAEEPKFYHDDGIIQNQVFEDSMHNGSISIPYDAGQSWRSNKWDENYDEPDQRGERDSGIPNEDLRSDGGATEVDSTPE